jgi:hypothetical protein
MTTKADSKSQLAINFAQTFDAMSLHARQRDALEAHLREHGAIDRDFAHNVGLPQCGKIKNLGARILDLRKKGMHIETDRKTDPSNCHYRLIE